MLLEFGGTFKVLYLLTGEAVELDHEFLHNCINGGQFPTADGRFSSRYILIERIQVEVNNGTSSGRRPRVESPQEITQAVYAVLLADGDSS
ncbi:hypothetical protein KAT59_06665, partial [Candidatus Bipolaricaulota bacterium]|nr:hypothetical protein [Candidatus Bipolaricaulota bacterium]